MANIAVHSEKPIAPAVELPEPVHMLRDLLRWSPFREVTRPGEAVTGFTPAFEVRESKDRFVFTADLPGVKESDVEISLAGSRLSIGGNREAERREENETYHAAERTYGSFARSFTLPEGVDAEHIVAELSEGVLTVMVPKAVETKERKIALRTGPKS